MSAEPVISPALATPLGRLRDARGILRLEGRTRAEIAGRLDDRCCRADDVPRVP